MLSIPKDATVLQIYEQSDGTRDIAFGYGDPRDYIWTTWSKSNWKSIDYLLGKVPDDQYDIMKKGEANECTED